MPLYTKVFHFTTPIYLIIIIDFIYIKGEYNYSPAPQEVPQAEDAGSKSVAPQADDAGSESVAPQAVEVGSESVAPQAVPHAVPSTFFFSSSKIF
jgi:cell division septation protein DedD